MINKFFHKEYINIKKCFHRYVFPLVRGELREKREVEKEIEIKREWFLDRTYTTLALSLRLHEAGDTAASIRSAHKHVPRKNQNGEKSSTTSNFLVFVLTEIWASLTLHITHTTFLSTEINPLQLEVQTDNIKHWQ